MIHFIFQLSIDCFHVYWGFDSLLSFQTMPLVQQLSWIHLFRIKIPSVDYQEYCKSSSQVFTFGSTSAKLFDLLIALKLKMYFILELFPIISLKSFQFFWIVSKTENPSSMFFIYFLLMVLPVFVSSNRLSSLKQSYILCNCLQSEHFCQMGVLFSVVWFFPFSTPAVGCNFNIPICFRFCYLILTFYEHKKPGSPTEFRVLWWTNSFLIKPFSNVKEINGVFWEKTNTETEKLKFYESVQKHKQRGK